MIGRRSSLPVNNYVTGHGPPTPTADQVGKRSRSPRSRSFAMGSTSTGEPPRRLGLLANGSNPEEERDQKPAARADKGGGTVKKEFKASVVLPMEPVGTASRRASPVWMETVVPTPAMEVNTEPSRAAMASHPNWRVSVVAAVGPAGELAMRTTPHGHLPQETHRIAGMGPTSARSHGHTNDMGAKGAGGEANHRAKEASSPTGTTGGIKSPNSENRSKSAPARMTNSARKAAYEAKFHSQDWKTSKSANTSPTRMDQRTRRASLMDNSSRRAVLMKYKSRRASLEATTFLGLDETPKLSPNGSPSRIDNSSRSDRPARMENSARRAAFEAKFHDHDRNSNHSHSRSPPRTDNSSSPARMDNSARRAAFDAKFHDHDWNSNHIHIQSHSPPRTDNSSSPARMDNSARRAAFDAKFHDHDRISNHSQSNSPPRTDNSSSPARMDNSHRRAAFDAKFHDHDRISNHSQSRSPPRTDNSSRGSSPMSNSSRRMAFEAKFGRIRGRSPTVRETESNHDDSMQPLGAATQIATAALLDDNPNHAENGYGVRSETVTMPAGASRDAYAEKLARFEAQFGLDPPVTDPQEAGRMARPDALLVDRLATIATRRASVEDQIHHALNRNSVHGEQAGMPVGAGMDAYAAKKARFEAQFGLDPPDSEPNPPRASRSAPTDALTNRLASIAARRASVEQQIHSIVARLSQTQRADSQLQVSMEAEEKGEYLSEYPGAYAGDEEGILYVRNQDMRYSLFGHEAKVDLEAQDQQEVDGSHVIALVGSQEMKDDEQSNGVPRVGSKNPIATTGLVEAIPVVNMSVLSNVDVELVDELELKEIEGRKDAKFRKAQRQAGSATVCGLVVIVSIFLIVYFTVIKDDGAGDSVPFPAGPSTPAPAPHTSIIFGLVQDTAEAILNSSATPPGRAYQWLKDDPSLESYPSWRRRQRFALATLYFSTTRGEGWTKSTNWMSYDEHECDWYFSKHHDGALQTFTADSPCGDDQETLERLWLQDNNLNGTIPPEIYWLTSLKGIDLSLNHLAGTAIRPEVGHLKGLDHIFLKYNYGLRSTIPTQVGILGNLRSLVLQGNMMSGSLPSQLGLLSSRGALWLEENQFTGRIPSQLGSMKELEILMLSANKLSGPIPLEFSKLSSLRYLLLEDNKLSGEIPSELWVLSNLYGFSVYGNILSGSLATEIGQMTGLREAMLQYNLLTGTLPTTIGNLSAVEGLMLDNNQFTGSIPTEMGLLTSLYDLWLKDNQLSGSLPSELVSVDVKESFLVNGNNLNGTIPTEIGRMVSVKEMSLQDNDLSGSLPSEVGLLDKLAMMNLTNNRLSGTLPSEIGQLEQLWSLHLELNNFMGPLPTEIAMLANLTSFRWSGLPAG